MALTTKRIIALPSQTDPQEGDYLAIDNATGGTHKIPAGRIGVEVDDTLTEQGKAADAKATGDALDEIRSQIEVTGTASGAIATFTDGAEMPAKSVIVNIEPQQSGAGTPSPENVRPISGRSSVNLYKSQRNILRLIVDGYVPSVSNGQLVQANGARSEYIAVKPLTSYVLSATPTHLTTYMFFYDADKRFLSYANGSGTFAYTTPSNTHFIMVRVSDVTSLGQITTAQLEEGSSATPYEAITTTPVNLGRTVYGGTLDVVSGELTAYPFYPSYNGETLNGRWICDRAVYAEGTTPPTGSQVALISGTGTTYQLTPTEVSTLLGENNVWADSGDVEITYIRDLNIAINNLLSGSGTRSLGMMAMSAPAKDTAEEPTDEQTEEPAEDDMR